MNFYDDFHREPSRPPVLLIVIIALVAALIGGLIGASLSPYVYKALPEGPQDRSYQFPQVSVDDTQSDSAITAVVKRLGSGVVSVSNKVNVVDWLSREVKTVERGTGSGVIFDIVGDKVYVVTNFHVVQDANEIVVTLQDNINLDATLVGIDPEGDLAVVQINGSDLPEGHDPLTVVPFGDSDKLQVGQQVIAIGNPLGLQQTVTVGVVSALNRRVEVSKDDAINYIQTDAAINAGNSGGALLSTDGLLVGINSAKLKGVGIEGLGFAIPSNTVQRVVEDIIRHGRVERPYIGITGGTLTPQIANDVNLQVTEGILIVEVRPGGPAYKAGLQPGDVIVAIDGGKVTAMEALSEKIRESRVGDRIRLRITRSRREFNVTVTLEAAPVGYGQ